jgi:competence protein ComEC
MNGGEVVARTIEGAAWTSGRSRLDAIVVSHADADHCNGLPNIVEVMPTRSLLVHRTFLDWSQPPVAAALEKASRAGIAITTIAAGQQIELDRDVTITILHPDVQFRGKADNANSLVLSIEYRGRRILLTGDLEREGLQKLLASEPMDTDVLLSPHHGSAAANGTDMARWSRPEWLIASCRDDKVRDRLEANFGPGTHVLTTARDGAVRCRITANGDLNVEPFKRRD